MLKYNKRILGALLLLIAEIGLAILGLLSLADDALFIYTKKETYAEILKIDKLELPNPYKVTVKYFNEYENKNIITYIDDIDGRFGATLPSKGEVNVFYKKYFPKEVYIINYKYPNAGYIVLNIVFLLIMSIAIYFQFNSLRDISKRS